MWILKGSIYGNAWDYWALGLCSSFGVLEKSSYRKLDMFPSSGQSVGDTLSCLVERANLSHWTALNLTLTLMLTLTLIKEQWLAKQNHMIKYFIGY
jgi:hypothetical protein